MTSIILYVNPMIEVLDLMDACFGITPSEQRDRYEAVKRNPEEAAFCCFQVHIEEKDIKLLLDKIELKKDCKELLCKFIWFVSNFYYRDNYFKYLQRAKLFSIESYVKKKKASDFQISDVEYDLIRDGLLDLYIAAERNRRSFVKAAAKLLDYKVAWIRSSKEAWDKELKEKITEYYKVYGEPSGNNWKMTESKYNAMATAEKYDLYIDKMISEDQFKDLNSQMEAECSIKIKFGNEGYVTLPGFNRWFMDFLQKRLFSELLPDIHNLKEAKDEKRKGRKPTKDPRVLAMVYGLSLAFSSLAKDSDKGDQVMAILGILGKMELENENGDLPSPREIRHMMDDLPKAKNDPRFWSPRQIPV